MRLVGLSAGRGVALAAGAAVAAVAMAGCSAEPSDNNEAVVVSGSTLAIYAAHPAAGAGGQAAADVYDAEHLAFEQSGAKVGSFRLAWRPVSGRVTSDEARTAVSDNTAIAYLGEIVPGSSGVSLQITNQLGLLQVSPTDTAAYLTQKVAVGRGASSALSGSPGHWYPASSNFHQTFARVVPTTAQEATALVARMRSQHVSSLTVGDDGSDYGVTVAAEVRAAAGAAGITVAAGTRPSGAGGYFYGASVATAAEQAHAVSALDAVASADPQARLYAPSGLYDDSFVAQLSPGAQSRLTVSSPGFVASQLNARGTAFVTAFQKAYGHAPAPEAIFGYEAVQALVATLTQAGNSANSRNAVVADFRSLKRSQSAIGSYAISNGDPSLSPAPFVMATVSGGKLVPHAQG